MNVVLRKFIYNDSEIYLINWNEKPCFIVSEIINAIDGIGKEDIQLFLRHNNNITKGLDYDIIQGDDARIFRGYLEDSGVKKRFAHTTIIFLSGLYKYSNYRRTRPIKDFCNYLENNKVYLHNDSSLNVLSSSTSSESINPEIQHAENNTTETEQDSLHKDICYNGYSDFLKHIAFMEDFVNSINKLSISPDKSIAFTKDMTKFLEDNSMQPEKLLIQIKKWIV